MLTDKNNLLITKNDAVLIPEPNITDIHMNEFMGTVIGFKNNLVIIQDSEGNCFEIEAERIEVVDGY